MAMAFPVAILAGGQSRRMGRDKALLPWSSPHPRERQQSQPLLVHMLTIARAAGADRIVVSGAPEKYGAFAPCIPDQFPGAGPLGGIASILRALPGPPVLALACDMPLMLPEFLRWLWARAQPGHWTVPCTAPDRPEPLCAVYASELLPFMDAALAAGDYKIARALAAAPQTCLTPAALTAAGFDLAIFRNCNTPADLGPGA